MTSPLDKLNLRPGEKRLVVVVAAVVFIMINWLLVKPHFGEVGKVSGQLTRERATIQRYEAEIARTPAYQKRVAELEVTGTVVATAEQALQLQVIVQKQASASGVAIYSTDSKQGGASRLSEFFDEYIVRVTANAGDKELVDFLYRLGGSDSLIRVRDLTLNPDPNGTKLNTSITFVASYQRTAPAKPAPARQPITTAKTAKTP